MNYIRLNTKLDDREIADTIIQYVEKQLRLGNLSNFTDLKIMNNVDGLAFDLRLWHQLPQGE